MAYRNGTYVTFHAGGTSDQSQSDIKYYRMLQAWHANDDIEFRFANSHEKTSAVRDSSSRETLRRALVTRLNNSKSMLVILTENTKLDRDWVPFEIEQAVDKCDLPLICAYPGYSAITAPALLSKLWPNALATRLNSGTAKAIHVAFAQKPLADAIGRYSVTNQPNGSLVHYTHDSYKAWGLV